MKQENAFTVRLSSQNWSAFLKPNIMHTKKQFTGIGKTPTRWIVNPSQEPEKKISKCDPYRIPVKALGL